MTETLAQPAAYAGHGDWPVDPRLVYRAMELVANQLYANIDQYASGELETPTVARTLGLFQTPEAETPVWCLKPERYAMAAVIGGLGLGDLIIGDGPTARFKYVEPSTAPADDPYRKLTRDLYATKQRAVLEMEHSPLGEAAAWLYRRYDAVLERDPSSTETRLPITADIAIIESEGSPELGDAVMSFALLMGREPELAGASDELLLTTARGLVSSGPLRRARMSTPDFRAQHLWELDYDRMRLVRRSPTGPWVIDADGQSEIGVVPDQEHMRLMCPLLHIRRPGDKYNLLTNFTYAVLNEAAGRGLLNADLAEAAWQQRKTARQQTQEHQ